MRPLVPLKSGDEYDALSRKSKRILGFRPGQRKKAKASYNRRVRRTLNPKQQEEDSRDGTDSTN